MPKVKFQNRDKVLINNKAPKVWYNKFNSHIGVIIGMYYGEYDVEFNINGHPVRHRLKSNALDKWDGGSKREIFVKELEKLEILEGELQRKRQGLQDRLNYMSEVDTEKFKESEYRAHKIIKISNDKDMEDADKIMQISKLIDNK